MAPLKFIIGTCLVVGVWALSTQLQNSVFSSAYSMLLLFIQLIFIQTAIMHFNRKTYIDPERKAVLITGCDTGFGHELAVKLDLKGFSVYACCLFANGTGANMLREKMSSKSKVIQLDVVSDEQLQKAVKDVKSDLGPNMLWALVNNAGIAEISEIEWCAVSQFQHIMNVNVMGMVRVTKAFLPLLRESKGRVVNVASLAGRFTLPAFSAYSMSKVACIAFSDGLRQEMNKFEIKVITVEPGLYKTPIVNEDSIEDKNRKCWAETPKDITDVYGEEYFDSFIKSIKTHLKRARSNVSEVVEMMAEAVCIERPKIRYVPYWLANIRANILMLLPSQVKDWIFGLRACKVLPTGSAKIHSAHIHS
ncbi:short-chain dehydrogenase/reductase family 9C member 7 [Octopus bimaculoides]|nr:short-chain dehydrogenase/reductase family 9C member 7 [Octopus bimaculoides]|eukprot:XP_014781652.1 PREDICTED: retinol dehydrogenase 3-like [Octopus bimaculoides]